MGLPRTLRLAGVIAAALTVVALTACTPAEYQQWWTSQGNPPLSEPELSRSAAAATAYWAEVNRRDRFRSTTEAISPGLAARMTPTSWRPGCPVPLSALRRVTVSHVGFDGSERVGELVVHADQASQVVTAFREMWNAGFRIERMRLVDDYGGDDNASMAANNTSAFNCRRVAGSTSWSQHSYGRAVDINPVQNPHVLRGVFSPPSGITYADRRNVRTGMIVAGGPAVAEFAKVGWQWGGNWSSSKDYQHFSVTGK